MRRQGTAPPDFLQLGAQTRSGVINTQLNGFGRATQLSGYFSLRTVVKRDEGERDPQLIRDPRQRGVQDGCPLIGGKALAWRRRGID
jgi:hypothetical protein